ncbi:hypothetical protein A2U01_0072878, partial [Trifolium medium]|nr:hypothetical protein [Trifolium medium]
QIVEAEPKILDLLAERGVGSLSEEARCSSPGTWNLSALSR